MLGIADTQARELLSFIALQCTEENGFGSLSPAVYDTAWVAMIEKQENKKTTFIFPESFDFIKAAQLADGSWAPNGFDVDGILNSLAALLALKRRARQNEQLDPIINTSCRKGEDALYKMLNQWDIEKSDRVGFEILVPRLLKLLENEGVHFDFPSRASLIALSDAKLSRLRPILASPVQTTLVHSLEAFVGDIDFDQVKHHKMPNGSMLGSPSSTAAYLMNSTSWDLDAEHYLRGLFEAQKKRGYMGGFPSAFPTTIFETVWPLVTLLGSGYNIQDFNQEDLDRIKYLLIDTLEKQGGVVGFAPKSLPDADDTAMAISALILMGEDPNIEPVLAHFQADSYFLTYHGERNPSISTNCNVFLCLLRSPQRSKYTKQMLKCATHLCQSWLAGNFQDKWNISNQYPMMLLAQAFVQFLMRRENNEFSDDANIDTLLKLDIAAILLGVLSKTIGAQQLDGSWDSKHEVTAYAILTLAPLLSLPWVEHLRDESISCIKRAKRYLHQNREQWIRGDHLWIEKVVYASSNLSQAYCLAAAKITVPKPHFTEITNRLCYQPQAVLAKFSKFFSGIPMFSDVPIWKLDILLLQSFQFIPLLKDRGFSIFPPMKKTSDEKYLQYIPFTWIACKDQLLTEISTDMLWEMMVISMLNFQVDAYMETVLEEEYRDNLEALKTLVRKLCAANSFHSKRKISETEFETSRRVRPRLDTQVSTDHESSLGDDQKAENGIEYPENDSNSFNRSDEQERANHLKSEYLNGASTRAFRDAENILKKFVTHILHHPRVLQSHLDLQYWLRYEVETFLIAHIAHMEDCAGLSKGTNVLLKLKSPSRCTYYQWARTTGSEHTSCPYSFVFYLCLVSKPKEQQWITSIQQRYALEDACHHLAAMCRQYNDFGSVARDRQEENLNSINFPEFEKCGEQLCDSGMQEVEEARKKSLLWIAEYERRCLNSTFLDLEKSLDPCLMSKLKLFVHVTDLYGQIYLTKDIGIRKKEGNSHA